MIVSWFKKIKNKLPNNENFYAWLDLVGLSLARPYMYKRAAISPNSIKEKDNGGLLFPFQCLLKCDYSLGYYRKKVDAPMWNLIESILEPNPSLMHWSVA